MGKYRDTPTLTDRMPGGVPYIIGNELAERFSFYGMKGILVIFMTKHLLDRAGNPAFMGEEEAKTIYHLFTAAAYFFPLLGALLSDIVLGKYRTIIVLSLGYCLGHGALALMDVGQTTGAWDMKPLLFAGLILIAIGAGGVKPCVSAHVGDQFGSGNKHLITKIFHWFYFSINVGAAASTMLTPIFLAKVGPWLAFGVPGVLMAIALFVFWLGRHRFVHIPPAGWQKFKTETFSIDGRRALLNLAPIFLIFVPMFWALFDQTGSAWVLQADKMNRTVMGVTILPSQIQAANPILILILIPMFSYVIYPWLNRFFRVTALRKISIGLFITAAAFAISSWIEGRVVESAPAAAEALWTALGTTGPFTSHGLEQALQAAAAAKLDPAVISNCLAGMPGIGWQIIAYIVITIAEVMVSITTLEFAYTQAPKKMKSFIMGVYFLGISLGNLFTAAVNKIIQNEDGTSKLEGADYYWFFTALMVVTAIAFVFYAMRYKGHTYIQGEKDGGQLQSESEAQEEGNV